ncbi:hypothetical protein AVEN_230169-1 [Araneus ventricosus]|uniref:Uncharacterized protein n=1 Tax=Araneus ventricosus TaxID=182803 RepID=A0A4Y2R8G5_ARAVE|nr:hypothetical protein AVEN_230169-1 [Araneus ventricosus]
MNERFEVTRWLFRDASEPRSHDEDGTWADTPLSKLPHHINDRIFDSRRQMAQDLQTLWFSMESSFESGIIRLRSRALNTRPLLTLFFRGSNMDGNNY